MKIVILEKEESLKVGGIIMHNKRLAQYLKKKGHDVKIIRFTNIKTNEENVITIPYYLAEKRTYILLPVENTKELLIKQLKKIKPDVVHFCIGISPFDFFTASVCHSLNIPVVGIWHSDITNSQNAFSLFVKSIYLAYLPVCKQLDTLVVFTNNMKRFYSKIGVKSSRIEIIPNGVDNQIYSPGKSSLKKKLRLTNPVVYLARLTLVKNPETLIKAFIKADVPNSQLVLAGTGDLEEALTEKYKEYKNIIFTGLISDEKEKVDLLRAAKVFVLPSLHEGMSLSLLEAMSCGNACVASDVGSNREVLQNAGISLDVETLENDLTLTIKLLLENPAFINSLGKSARKKAVENYNEKKSFDQYFKLYKKIIKNYHKSGPPEPISQELYSTFAKKFKTLWEKAKDFSENYLLG